MYICIPVCIIYVYMYLYVCIKKHMHDYIYIYIYIYICSWATAVFHLKMFDSIMKTHLFRIILLSTFEFS